MNDPVQNNSTINNDPQGDFNDDIYDIEQTRVDDHYTKTTGAEDHKLNNSTKPEQDHHNNDVP